MLNSFLGRSWTWRQILKRAAEVIREEGLRSLWFKILGETACRRVMLMERPLNEPVEQMTARLPVTIHHACNDGSGRPLSIPFSVESTL